MEAGGRRTAPPRLTSARKGSLTHPTKASGMEHLLPRPLIRPPHMASVFHSKSFSYQLQPWLSEDLGKFACPGCLGDRRLCCNSGGWKGEDRGLGPERRTCPPGRAGQSRNPPPPQFCPPLHWADDPKGQSGGLAITEGGPAVEEVPRTLRNTDILLIRDHLPNFSIKAGR